MVGSAYSCQPPPTHDYPMDAFPSNAPPAGRYVGSSAYSCLPPRDSMEYTARSTFTSPVPQYSGDAMFIPPQNR